MKFSKVFAAGLATGVALTTLTIQLLDILPSSVSTGTQHGVTTSNPTPIRISFPSGLGPQSEELTIPGI